jgi:hypothetical protein|tara:strand:+ start:526 stop:708 length:183 start_codon:yes stop_codon:yes gene_type:complete
MEKTVFQKNVSGIIRNPVGLDNIQFRRTTGRYKQKGTFSNNKGYLMVSRDEASGKFVKRA